MEAECVPEEACLARFAALRQAGPTLVMCSPNILISQSRRFGRPIAIIACDGSFYPKHPGPEQHRLTLFPQSQSRMLWRYKVDTFAEARVAITQLINWYNVERPHHQACGYSGPRQYRAFQSPNELEPFATYTLPSRGFLQLRSGVNT
jgi:hypothetical protein